MVRVLSLLHKGQSCGNVLNFIMLQVTLKLGHERSVGIQVFLIIHGQLGPAKCLLKKIPVKRRFSAHKLMWLFGNDDWFGIYSSLHFTSKRQLNMNLV